MSPNTCYLSLRSEQFAGRGWVRGRASCHPVSCQRVSTIYISAPCLGRELAANRPGPSHPTSPPQTGRGARWALDLPLSVWTLETTTQIIVNGKPVDKFTRQQETRIRPVRRQSVPLIGAIMSEDEATQNYTKKLMVAVLFSWRSYRCSSSLPFQSRAVARLSPMPAVERSMRSWSLFWSGSGFSWRSGAIGSWSRHGTTK